MSIRQVNLVISRTKHIKRTWSRKRNNALHIKKKRKKKKKIEIGQVWLHSQQGSSDGTKATKSVIKRE